MLTIDTIPLRLFSIFDCRFEIAYCTTDKSKIANRKSKISLFVFFVYSMATAATAIFFEFEPFRCRFLIFRRHVIALFAFGTLQNYIISRHKIL